LPYPAEPVPQQVILSEVSELAALQIPRVKLLIAPLHPATLGRYWIHQCQAFYFVGVFQLEQKKKSNKMVLVSFRLTTHLKMGKNYSTYFALLMGV